MAKKVNRKTETIINWTGFEITDREQHGIPVGDAIIHKRFKCPCDPSIEYIKRGKDNNTIVKFYLHKIQDVAVKENA